MISIWHSMIQRCKNPENKNYGGRGIKVCDRWLNSFECFVADMGMKPTPNHSIDRIDNDGNYTPENCKWSTRQEQAANKSNNVKLTAFGETKTLAMWHKDARCKVSASSILHRLKLGFSAEAAIALENASTNSRHDSFAGCSAVQVSLVPQNAKGVEDRVKGYQKAGLKLSFNSVANEVIAVGLEQMKKESK